MEHREITLPANKRPCHGQVSVWYGAAWWGLRFGPDNSDGSYIARAPGSLELVRLHFKDAR